MRKIITISLILILIFASVACDSNNGNENSGATNDGQSEDGNNAESTPSKPPGFELALITDLGTIDDKSFNHGAWEGLAQYAREFNITHKYYQSASKDNDGYLGAIGLAVQGGAKVIVTPGFLFEVPVFLAQDLYPDVKFILLDGTPNNGDYGDFVVKIGDNTVSVAYAEEQSGFLAGYSAVKDGYRNLGFMGGMDVPAVIRFGLGYIQGAEFAAQELGLADGSVKLNYFYTGTFDPAPEIQTMATSWYDDGVEVIFSCGGGIYFSIFPAAQKSGKKVIGVDVDQSDESEAVITSAMKLLTKSVYDCLADYYAGNFQGGKNLIYSAENLGVGLPMETSRFTSFSQSDYEDIYERLSNGSVVVDNDLEANPETIPAKAVVVNFLGD